MAKNAEEDLYTARIRGRGYPGRYRHVSVPPFDRKALALHPRSL